MLRLNSLAAILLIATSSVTAQVKSYDTVYVSRFGVKPGTRTNSVAGVQSAIESCRGRSNPLLVFEKGRYDFWPQYSTEKVYFESNTTVINPRRCPILIEGFDGLTVDGSGSEFIFHDRVQPITIDHSKNISIRNVNIDWDLPLTAQAEVIDTSATSIDLRIDRYQHSYILEDQKLVFTGEGWKSRLWGMMEFDPVSGMIVPGTGDAGVLGDNWESYVASELSPGQVRLTFPFKRKPAIGHVLVLRHNERDHAGIFIIASSGIRLDHIIIYHTAGLGVLSQFSSNLDFRSVHVVPNKEKGRLFSGHDDGFHFSNCRGSIYVDSCSFSGLMDDPINIHGTAVQVIEKRNNNQLLCRFMHDQSVGMEWARAGDTVGYIEHKSMQTASFGTVASFEPLSTTDFLLTMNEPVPAGLNLKDALENLSWTPSVIIRHSLFAVNRARGILVSTPRKVLIDSNRFESSGSAILIAGDANQWFESGAVQDVTISGNDFSDACLTSMYQFCEAIISIDPEIPSPDSKKPFHRNIRITGNHFHPFDYPVLYAKSTSGISFTNNTIEKSARFKPFHYRKSMLTFERCQRVVVASNRLVGEVLGKNITLLETPTRELKQSGNKLRVEMPRQGQ